MSDIFATTPSALLAIAGASIGIWLGSELVVANAKALAVRLRLTELTIGLTVVSIGSSLPEIFLNIAAGRAHAPTIGIGSVIGSCFGQITIILGLCILFGGTAIVDGRALKRDGTLLIGCIFLMMLLGADGHYSRTEGLTTIGLYLAYLAYLVKKGAQEPSPWWMHWKRSPPHRNPLLTGSLLLIGMGIVYLCAEVLVSEGTVLGQRFGLPEVFIGMLAGLLAATPELAVSVTALRERSSAISIGNLIGSNITDPLFSLGIGTVIGNYTFDFVPFVPAFLFWILGSLVAILFMRTGWRVQRWEAFPLIAVYGGYLVYTLA